MVGLFAAGGGGQGKGAVTTKSGHMVDLPHLRRAEKVLARAQAAGALSASGAEGTDSDTGSVVYAMTSTSTVRGEG